jgi:hypothetical protein
VDEKHEKVTHSDYTKRQTILHNYEEAVLFYNIYNIYNICCARLLRRLESEMDRPNFATTSTEPTAI